MAHSAQHQAAVRNRLLAALSPEDWAHLEPHLEAVELATLEWVDCMVWLSRNAVCPAR